MIKNRIVQIIFQAAFCTLGLIGITISLDLFDYTYHRFFFIHFTNLSNYLCIGIMLVELIQTIKKKSNSYVTTLPTLKFIGMLSILLTFIVFNFIIAPERENYTSYNFSSILFHIILPIMFIIDWLLFYERGNVKWYYPLLSIIFPFIYIVFIYTRAWIFNFNNNFYIYPYFFLNLDNQGIIGTFKWLSLLLALFLINGFVFLKIDHVLKFNKNK